MKYFIAQSRRVLSISLLLALMLLSSLILVNTVAAEYLPIVEKHVAQPSSAELTPVTREMFFTRMQTEGDILIDAGTLGKYRFAAPPQPVKAPEHIIRQELLDLLNEIQKIFKEPIKIEVGYRSPEQHIYQWAKWLRDNPDKIATLNAENHASWEAWVKASQHQLEGCPPLHSKHQTGDAVTFVRNNNSSQSSAGLDLLLEHLRGIGGTREYTAEERTLYNIPDNENYLFNIAGIVKGENLQFSIEYVPSQTPPMPTIDEIGEKNNRTVVQDPTKSPVGNSPVGNSPVGKLTPVTREMFFTEAQTVGDIIIDAGALGIYQFTAIPQTATTPEHVIRQELLDLLNEIQKIFKEPIKIEVGYRSPEQHIYQWAKWLRENPDIIATLNTENHVSWEAWVKASQKIEGCPPLHSKHQTGDAVTFMRSSENSLSGAGGDLLMKHLRDIGGTREYTAEERTLYNIPEKENYLFNITSVMNGENLQYFVEYVPSQTPPTPNVEQLGKLISKPTPTPTPKPEEVQEIVPSVEGPDNTPLVVTPEMFTALLSVTSKPSGAKITVNGKLIGITPIHAYEFKFVNTPSKQVKVTLSLEGYQDNEKSITLENGKTATWNNVVLNRSTQVPTGIQTTKMVLIPAGTFMMGSEKERIVGGKSLLPHEDSKPVHKVFLRDYYIDEHEVTVGQYREFVEKTGHREPLWRLVEKYSPTDNHPMVGISWYDAMAYALWVGKRLPTEAEWEKAARGGHINKDYPWGTDEISPAFAHYRLENDDNPIERTQPVKSYPPNDFGLYDMAGNVSEWCLDEYDATFYYRSSPANNPIAGIHTIQQIIDSYKDIEGTRVTRGGSYSRSKVHCRVCTRTKNESNEIYKSIGFRCVKDVSQ